MRKTKWLLFGSYHLPSQSGQYDFDCVGRAKDTYLNYDKPKELLYRDEVKLSPKGDINSYKDFESKFLHVLNNNTPMKKKIPRI